MRLSGSSPLEPAVRAAMWEFTWLRMLVALLQHPLLQSSQPKQIQIVLYMDEEDALQPDVVKIAYRGAVSRTGVDQSRRMQATKPVTGLRPATSCSALLITQLTQHGETSY